MRLHVIGCVSLAQEWPIQICHGLSCLTNEGLNIPPSSTTTANLKEPICKAHKRFSNKTSQCAGMPTLGGVGEVVVPSALAGRQEVPLTPNSSSEGHYICWSHYIIFQKDIFKFMSISISPILWKGIFWRWGQFDSRNVLGRKAPRSLEGKYLKQFLSGRQSEDRNLPLLRDI